MPRSSSFLPRGFTLVEMLVVISIVAMAGLSISTTFAAGMKLHRRSQQSLKIQLEAGIALERMSMDLENMVLYDFSGSYPQLQACSTDGSSIIFLQATGKGLKAIRYFLEPRNQVQQTGTTMGKQTSKNVKVVNFFSKGNPSWDLIRQESDFVSFLEKGFTSAGAEVLSEDLPENGLTFKFAELQGDGQISWLAEWNKSSLPLGVRVELILADSSSGTVRFSREVLIPVGGLAERGR